MVSQQFLAASLFWLVRKTWKSLGTPVSDRVFQAATKSRVCPHRKVQRFSLLGQARYATEAGDMSRSLTTTTTIHHHSSDTNRRIRKVSVGVAVYVYTSLCSLVHQWVASVEAARAAARRSPHTAHCTLHTLSRAIPAVEQLIFSSPLGCSSHRNNARLSIAATATICLSIGGGSAHRVPTAVPPASLASCNHLSCAHNDSYNCQHSITLCLAAPSLCWLAAIFGRVSATLMQCTSAHTPPVPLFSL
jgi:hypothetical protein